MMIVKLRKYINKGNTYKYLF